MRLLLDQSPDSWLLLHSLLHFRQIDDQIDGIIDGAVVGVKLAKSLGSNDRILDGIIEGAGVGATLGKPLDSTHTISSCKVYSYWYAYFVNTYSCESVIDYSIES